MAEEKYNLKNPAVKKIPQEVKEMQSNPSDDFMSLPLEAEIESPVPKLTLSNASEDQDKSNNGDPQMPEAGSSGDDELNSVSQLRNDGTEVNPVVEEDSDAVSRAEISDSRDILQRGSGTGTRKPASDWVFTWAAVGLTIAIVVLLLKKFLPSGQHGTVSFDRS